MELLSPSPPPCPALEIFSGDPSPAPLRHLFASDPSPGLLRPPGCRHVAAGIVHVAVGRSQAKTLGLLHWTFRHFGCSEVALVHVHQPSPMIPTPLGKLPANRANDELLSAYRREERDTTDKLLFIYLSACYRAQVQANIIMTESEHIPKGITTLVASHGIQKLVIGAALNNCFKVKGSSCKATYTAKNAPPFCEIWFVSKGKHIWTREASESTDPFLPVLSPLETVPRDRIRSSSLHSQISEPIGTNQSSSENSSLTSTSTFASPVEINSKEELELEVSYNRLNEVVIEVERLKREAFTEMSRRKKLESEFAEACNKVNACEAARSRETKFREELESQLGAVKQQQEELLCQRNEAMQELQNTTSRVGEVAAKLELFQSSIENLRRKIQWQRKESVRKVEIWSCGRARYPVCKKFGCFGSEPSSFMEFSLSDLQTATCEFSENFLLGQGGYGCLYKGEMLNRSVTIKKLHPHNVQSQLEFQQEVYVHSKIRHPHLVSLIGLCQEALSLVYQFLPNGSLQDCLFRQTNNPPLPWKVRIRIAAEIASALLYLHSSRPEKIIHGDLEPEKIFFDSDFKCKIVGFGLGRLEQGDPKHDPLFRWIMEPKGPYPYADPEYQRTGVLTTKSDVYSFGIIILQLLTGRPPLQLANEVRWAMSAGRLTSVLDKTAGNWPIDVATRLAEFGLRCSEMNRRDRPELVPEVVRELQKLHVPEERPVPHFFLCPILQEIMHDPQVAADGFTYEGNALRGWLQSGRDTSPMTNLRLEHINLTPNHVLRFAIHDWLCGSSVS